MFDLEQAIVEWRRQMQAVGIKTPVPLEELENHLREEIERQIQIGVTEQQAFEMATAQIGQAEPLKAEFKKSSGFLGWLGEDKSARTTRILALLWLAFCSQGFFSIAAAIFPMFYGRIFYGQQLGINLGFFCILLIEFIFLQGIVASIALFAGNKKRVWTIRFIAVLMLFLFVAQIISLRTFSSLAYFMTAFNIASIWLLRSPKNKELKPTAN
jgi:hypothetical protein